MTIIKIPIEEWVKQMQHIHYVNEDDFFKDLEIRINNLLECHTRRLICEALEKAHNEHIKGVSDD